MYVCITADIYDVLALGIDLHPRFWLVGGRERVAVCLEAGWIMKAEYGSNQLSRGVVPVQTAFRSTHEINRSRED